MDFCCRVLELNAELVACLNDAQFAEAIKEAEVCHASTVCTLQQAHRDSVLMLECEVKAEEGQNFQTFMEAFGVVMQSCLPKTHGAPMYPLQLLTGDQLLAAIPGMLATAQLWAVADRGPALAASIPSVLVTLAPQVGATCQCCSSDQGVPTQRQDKEEVADIDNIPKEHLCKKQKDGRLGGRLWKSLREKLFLKSQTLWRQPDGPTKRPIEPISNRRGHTTYPPCSDKWPPPLTSWGLRSMRCRRSGLARKISGPPVEWPRPPQRTSTFFKLSCPQSHQNHGPQGDPFLWGPAMMRWPVILPLVWQSGSEWGDDGKSPADYALPPWPHLHPLPGLLYYQCRCHASPCPCLQAHDCWQWWWWQGRRALWGQW